MRRKKDKPLGAEEETLDGEIDAGPDNDLDIVDRPDSETQPAPAEAISEHEAAVARRSRRTKPGGAVARAEPRLPSASIAQPAPPRGPRTLYIVAIAASVLWVALLVAFFFGYVRGAEPFNLEPLALAVGAGLAAGVLLIIWVLAFLSAQGLRLSAQSRYVHARADELMHPALLAAGDTRTAVELVRVEIEGAVAAASQARHELVTLREVLASETARLVEAAAGAARTATALTQSLGQEREALESLSDKLAGQVGGVEEAIARQARMVAEAADLAEVQIREAEAALTARAGDLAAAAGDAADAARTAGEDLGRQAAKLEAASGAVADQVRVAEDTLTEQRAAIVQAAHQLRAEQEDFAAQVESQQAVLTEILAQMRANAAELGVATGNSTDALKTLIQTSAEQFREVADAAAEERDQVGAAALRSIGALSESARQERENLNAEARATIEALAGAAAEAKAASEAQAEAARQRIEQLSEAAFSAGQKADAAFEARLAEAQGLIEQSVNLVEEAGRKAGERLAQGLQSATVTVDKLEGLLAELDKRAQQLPADAEARSAEIKAAVEQGVEQLLDAARRAADETQAIDAAFQERVKRNYEMLSESVRLMGVVGGAPLTRPPRAAPRPIEGAAARPEPPRPAPPVERVSPVETSPVDEPEGLADDGRPRLRLRPAEEPSPDPMPADPVPPAPTPAPDGEGWTWKELLSSIDGETSGSGAPPRDLLHDIRELGIDSAALLPPSRVAEIVAVLQAGDQVGAREIVRASAPAAMRRLSRRILTDDSMRASARDFSGRCEAKIDEAAAGAGAVEGLTSILASDEGRAYLLIDAAVGDFS